MRFEDQALGFVRASVPLLALQDRLAHLRELVLWSSAEENLAFLIFVILEVSSRMRMLLCLSIEKIKARKIVTEKILRLKLLIPVHTLFGAMKKVR